MSAKEGEVYKFYKRRHLLVFYYSTFPTSRTSAIETTNYTATQIFFFSSSIFTYEKLSTTVKQIEAILNLRLTIKSSA